MRRRQRSRSRTGDRHDDDQVDAHTRLLTTPVGQAAVGVAVFVLSIWIVGPNMPASPARDVIDIVWSPALDIGLDQSWEVFSPNPRDQTLDVVARLSYDDGTTAEWRIPDYDPVFGQLRGYRWRKWQERVRLDDNQGYWEPTATWIAANNRRDGNLPVTVRLVRRWQVLAPLTVDGIAPTDFNEFEFYVWTRDE